MTTNNELHTFNFAGLELRAVHFLGESWFGAPDACRVLGTSIRADGKVNVNAALMKLGASEKRNLTYPEAERIGLQRSASRAHGMSMVSESGIASSRTKPRPASSKTG